MNYIKVFLYVEILVCAVTGVKVNVQGSLTLGKDVIDSLSYYLGSNMLSGRRSLMPAPIEDPITLLVRTALLCKDLDFCQNELQHFVNEYIIILAKAVESVMAASLLDFNSKRYEEQLMYTMDYIRKILEDANAHVDNDVYYWVQSIKKVNGKFQEMIDVFVPYVESDPNNDKYKEKSILNHKIVIATTYIERKYELKLCLEHDICLKSYECTRVLNKMLTHFETLPEDRIRMFLRYVYESLFDSSFYTYLSVSTANDFQVVLNDMVYSNDTPTKDVMLSVHKTVQARLEMIKTNKILEVAHDILIAHAILSDLDHMFSNRTDPFIMFLNRFYDWLSSDTSIGKYINGAMRDISKEIWSHEEDLVLKLINEVKVFLEMTVGPEYKSV